MSIIPFEGWEESQRIMREAEVKANASVVRRQRDIVYGSYWVRASADGMLEFGQVLGQSSAEYMQTKETIRALRDAYERGYRFSRAHSVLCPEGELGDTHLAVMWPITKEEFEKALVHGFARSNEEWELAMLRRVIREMSEAPARPTPTPQEG